MSLVFEEQVGGPATHAIVIGVGAYVYLPGGKGQPKFPDHEGMGQLTSPPHSARAFANWLLEKYQNPGKPLGSLELLLSDSQGSEFTLPGGAVEQVERANYSNAERAILDWKQRGDGSTDHFLIFYFCGHGVARGLITSLLLDDFGELQDHPLKQAIDFRGLYAGMDLCKARQQWYLVDACRKASPNLITRYNHYAGAPIIPGSAYHSHGTRYAPTYNSTVPGSSAYGRTGEPSVFTEVLLKAMDGAGSNDIQGDWRVDADTLYTGIRCLLGRAIGHTAGLEQVCVGGELVPLTLHYLHGKPLVPVAISCDPDEGNELAVLSYAFADGSGEVVRPEMQTSQWDIDVEEGDYRFAARFPRANYRDNYKVRYVRPPFRPISIEV